MKYFKLSKITLHLSCALLGMTMVAPVTYAEEKQTEDGEVNVITISRKRPENMQEVPIAIIVMSEDELEAAGVERSGDIFSLIPNITLVDTANIGDTQVSIRGIVSTRDAESTFAYIVDGILMTNPNRFSEELVDVAQIEVIKGPQGALYGRNAVAGAILVTTNDPSDEFQMKVKAGVANNNTQSARVTLSGRLAESVNGRISASYSNTDGFYKNDFSGRDDVVDFSDNKTVKGRISWEVNSILDLDFRGSFSEAKGGAINFNASFALPSFVEAFNQPAFFSDVNQHDFIFAFNVPGENEQKTKDFSVKANWYLDGYEITAFAAYSDLDEYLLSDGTSATFYGYELTAQCQADRATLNNLPVDFGGAGRTDLFGEFFAPFGVLPPGNDFAGVYGPYTPTSCDGYQYQERNQTDTSFEVRLTSDGSSEYRWIAGLYFSDIERDVVVAYGADTGQGFLRQAYVDPTGPNPTDLLFDDTFDTSVYSVFCQMEFDLAEDFELSLALRYDREERSVSNNVPNVTASGLNINTYVNGVLGPINPAFNTNPGGIPDRSQDFTQLQPKISLSWKMDDNINLYTSYGVGFRSGGFNSIGTQATLDFWFNASGTGTPGDAVDAKLQVKDDYAKEITQSVELGMKTMWLDRRLRINAAIFHNQIEDNQFFEFFAGPFGLLRAVTTIDELEIQGLEMDFKASISDEISFFGGLGLLTSEIKENQNRPLTVGNDAPQAPDRTFNLGSQFVYEMSDLYLVTRLDWQYIGEMWFHTLQGERTPTIWDFFGTLGGGVPPGPHHQDLSSAKRDAYSTLNLRVSIENQYASVSLWAKNLTDENYLQEVIPAPEFGGSFIHPSAERSYGIEFRYEF